MQLDDALYGRRSVRSYLPDPVAEDDVNDVIRAATQAPSAMNDQPWAFTVIRDQDLLERISRQSKSFLLAQESSGMPPSSFRNQLADPHFQIFYHAPALVVISAMTKNAWSAENCALAAQNLMLAAFAKGLGTCWIGFAQHWLQTDEGKTALHLPHHYHPVAPLVLGHPKSETAAVPRRPATIGWRD